MRLEYVDIFYSHRPDPETPLEETMGALAHAVRSGKALYVGVSNYPAELTAAAARILREERVPLLIHQPRYNLFDRWVENGLLETLEKVGAGCIAFSPLAQGLLAGRYIAGIPSDARAAIPSGFLSQKVVHEKAAVVGRLAAIAKQGNRTLPELALQWVLRDPRVTSVLTGASSPEQIEQNVAAVRATPLDESELEAIEAALASGQS
jgi:L-glyceraldehyde 3-phosphate reductase